MIPIHLWCPAATCTSDLSWPQLSPGEASKLGFLCQSLMPHVCLSPWQAVWPSGTECIAKYNFHGTAEQDLPFSKGDVLTIIAVTKVTGWDRVGGRGSLWAPGSDLAPHSWSAPVCTRLPLVLPVQIAPSCHLSAWLALDLTLVLSQAQGSRIPLGYTQREEHAL